MENNFYNQLEKIANKEGDLGNKKKFNFIIGEIDKNKKKIKNYIDRKNFSLENIYEQFSCLYDDLSETKYRLLRISETPKKLDLKKINNFIRNNFIPYELGYYSFPKELKEKIKSKLKYNDFIEFINIPISEKAEKIAKKYNIT